MFSYFRKRESPAERRVVEDKFRGERSADGIQAGGYRERNERFDRNERFERGRQSPHGQRPERFDRRNPEGDFRRDHRIDANQPEWRNRERVPGKFQMRTNNIFFKQY